MGRTDFTAHGFRATFKTWASECSRSQNEIVEAALAHTIGSKVEQSYMRSDLLQKRRRLMEAWGSYCTTAPAQQPQNNVTALRSAS
jgi:integrase